MRVVYDTNVLVSAVLFGGLPRRLLDRALRGDVDLVTSPALLDEWEDLLVARFGFDRATARLTRTELEAAADLCDPADVPRTSRDADDDAVLGTAIAGQAEAIVTGDRDLLVLERFGAIVILTPRQFADLLD